MPLCLIKLYAMKTCGRVEVSVRAFLTSALDVGERLALRPNRFSYWKEYHVPVELNWLQSHFEEDNNILPLPKTEPRIPPHVKRIIQQLDVGLNIFFCYF